MRQWIPTSEGVSGGFWGRRGRFLGKVGVLGVRCWVLGDRNAVSRECAGEWRHVSKGGLRRLAIVIQQRCPKLTIAIP